MNSLEGIKFKKKHIISGIGIIAFIVISFILTCGDAFGLFSFRDVFNACGLKEFSYNAEDYPMSVHVLDVGKADSIFITCEGKNVLIDAGEHNIYNYVNEYLRKMGVKTIDFLMLSHQHSDHAGGMSAIVEEFNINKFMMPKLRDDMIPTFRSYEKLLMALERKRISVSEPVPGTSFNVGKMSIEIFAPNNQYSDMNDNSIVTKVTYKNKSFLFTGDAGRHSENDMIAKGFNLKSDVLKVGHHGSRTSTTQQFLNSVAPKYAVISVGADRNNLPKKETVDRLKRNNINLYRTDLDGTVIFLTDGDKMEVITEKEGK